MDYLQFDALTETPTGLAFTGKIIPWGLHEYPLEFYTGDDKKMVLEQLDDFGSLDDILDEYEIESFEEDFETLFPHYAPLAMLDYDSYLKKFSENSIDSYTEFALFVDTSSPKYPILLFSSEYWEFEEIVPSFKEFYDGLSDFLTE